MTGHMQSFWRPLMVIIALMILATSAIAASNLSFSIARNIDPYLRTEQLKDIEPNAPSLTATSRTDVNGHLVIYVAEPTGRWLDNGQSFPSFPPTPFHNAVIAYPYDEEVYFDESFDLTFDWDATAAGFGDITEGNIKVVAALFKTVGVPTTFVVPGNPSISFSAKHLIASAEAFPGVPGSNYSDVDYTHTVFIEEDASTW